MSVRMLSRVWDYSKHAGTDLLMMLAIADFADDDGVAYPSIATLATKCRTSSRNVSYVLARLRDSEELIVGLNEGPHGANLYRITLPLKPASPLKDSSPHEEGFTPEESFTLKPASSTPEAGFLKPLKPASPKPSVNRQEPSEGERAEARTTLSADGKKRKHPLITFDTFVERKKAAGEKLIAEDDPIFAWTERAGIPDEWLHLAWIEFGHRYRGNAKRYADWPATFRNSIRSNWYRLWRLSDSGQYLLTTEGEMARRAAQAAEQPSRSEVAA